MGLGLLSKQHPRNSGCSHNLSSMRLRHRSSLWRGREAQKQKGKVLQTPYPVQGQPAPSHLPHARARGGAGSGHWRLPEAGPQTLGHRPWRGSGRCPHPQAGQPPAVAGRFWKPPSPWQCAGPRSQGPGCPHPPCPAGQPGGQAQVPLQVPSPSPRSTRHDGLVGAGPLTHCTAAPRAPLGRSDAHQAPLSLPAGWLKHRRGRGVREAGEGTERLSFLDSSNFEATLSATRGPGSHPSAMALPSPHPISEQRKSVMGADANRKQY